MDFSSERKKAWKDIWGAGQGVGAVRSIEPAAAVMARLRQEYEQAATSLRSAKAWLRGA
jgi:nitronate monooxygenase